MIKFGRGEVWFTVDDDPMDAVKCLRDPSGDRGVPMDYSGVLEFTRPSQDKRCLLRHMPGSSITEVIDPSNWNKMTTLIGVVP